MQQIQFREPTLFEYVLYDLGNYSTFEKKQKIISCLPFANVRIDEKTSMSEIESMIRGFDIFLRKGAKLLTLVKN